MKKILCFFLLAFLVSGRIMAQWVIANTTFGGGVICFTVSGNNIFAGTSSGIYLSSNNGTDWSPINNGLTNTTINALTVSGTNTFAGTNGGVFLSTNYGISWTAVNNGLTSNNVQALAVSGPAIFAGTWDGVFMSTNNGGNWLALNSGPTAVFTLMTSGLNIFASTWAFEGYLYRSIDNGANWAEVSVGVSTPKSYALSMSGTSIFAGLLNNGVYHSTDNGTTWTAVNDGLVKTDVTAIVINNSDIFVGTYDGEVWKRSLSEFGPSVTLTAPNGDEAWQIGSSQNITWSSISASNLKIDYTTDGGASWIQIIASTPASSGSYGWTVPNNPSTNCRVRITDISNVSHTDISDTAFSIYNDLELVAFYPFNGNCNDESGNGNNGNNHGAVLTSDRFGNADNAYKFDGSSNYIEVADNSALRPNKFSISVWAKMDSSTIPYQHIISKSYRNASTMSGYVIQFLPDSSTISFWTADGSANHDNHVLVRNVSSNEWHNITATYDGLVKKLYYDGRFIDSAAFSMQHSTYPLDIGRMPSGINYFKGSIDDIRIFNKVLTSSEVSSLYYENGFEKLKLLTPNGGENWIAGTSQSITWLSDGVNDVKIEYSTDDGNSWNIITSSMSASTLNYSWTVPNTTSANCIVRISDAINPSFSDTSDAVFSISSFAQDAGSAYYSDLSSIRVKDAEPINPNANPSAYIITGNQITVEAWVFPFALPENQNSKMIVARPYYGKEPWRGYDLSLGNWGATDHPSYMFIIGDGKMPINAAYATDTSLAQTGEWVHLAGTYDGVNVKLYKNGILVASAPFTANIGAGDTGFYIGSFGQLDKTFQGLIDEIRVWNIARTQTEIQNDMSIVLHGNESGLVGYWPLDKDTTVNGVSRVTIDKTNNHNDLEVRWNTTFLSLKPGDAVEVIPLLFDGESLEATIGEAFQWVIPSYGWPKPSLTIISGAAGMTINQNEQRLEWTPQAGQKGYINFTIETSNSAGSVQKSYSVFVNDVPQYYKNHNNNNIVLSVFNDGTIGNTNDGGSGFIFDGKNGMMEGDILIGKSVDQVSGRLYKREFDRTHTIESFPSLFSGFDQAFRTTFDDSRAINPIGLGITQTSHSKSTAPDKNYVILEYDITNTTSTTLDNLVIGLITDLDVGNSENNLGGFDNQRRLNYIYEASGDTSNYYGVVALTDKLLGSLIYSPTQSVFSETNSDSAYYQAMSSIHILPTVPSDMRSIITVGPYSILPNNSQKVFFALVGGTNLTDLQNNANNALSIQLTESPTVQLTAPDGGENWIVGSSHNITWSSNNVTAVKLELSTDDGSNWNEIIASTPAANGTYSWTVPNSPAKSCRIGITDVSSSSVFDISDNTFTISQHVNKTLQLTNPVGNENWKVASNQIISWTSSGISNVDLYYSTNSGVDWSSIDSDIPSANGSANWNVPNTPSNLCKVRVLNSADPTLASQSSGTFTIFDYSPTIILSESITFTDLTSSSYRMIGLPGDINILVGNLLSGEHKTDWNVYYDNGVISQNTSDYLVEYDGGSLFHFKPGKAFWILSKNGLSASGQQNSVQIDADNNYTFALHNNWNLISNPFNRSVLWSTVVAANNITQNPLLYSFNGSWNNAASVMRPYEGYYFYNVQNLAALKIPYDPNGALGKENTYAMPENLSDNRIEIQLISGGEEKTKVIVAIDEESKADFDEKDYFAPPGTFEEVSLKICNPKLTTAYKYLFAESRPMEDEGQLFEVELFNSSKEKLTLRRTINSSALLGYEVYLIDNRLAKPINLRETSSIDVASYLSRQSYTLAIGTKDFIETIKSSLLPKQFELFQNYPNPFNPTTTIRYALPKRSVVRLIIFDILGKEVNSLVNETKEPGYYEVEFDGSQLSSGVYICTLNAGEFISIKKLMLVK